jgi:hypothetical protein
MNASTIVGVTQHLQLLMLLQPPRLLPHAILTVAVQPKSMLRLLCLFPCLAVAAPLHGCTVAAPRQKPGLCFAEATAELSQGITANLLMFH